MKQTKTPDGVNVCFFMLRGRIKLKPIVGVIPLWEDDKDSMWMLPGYMEGIRQTCAAPIIFPFSNDEGRAVTAC